MKGLIVTYVMTYGGAAVGLFNPYMGLLVYIAFAILKPDSLWFWAVPEGNYSRIVAIPLLIGWAFRGFGTWRFGRGRYVVLAVLAHWAWCVLGAAIAPDQDVAWRFTDLLTKIVLPCLVGITLIDSVAKLKQLAWVILLAEGYVAFEMNLSYLGGFNRLQEDGFGGMDNNCNAIAMVTCMGLAFFLGLTSRHWWEKAISLLVAILLAHCIFFAFSRGGMLAMIVTGAVAFFLLPKQPKHYLMFAAIVLVMLRLAGPEVQKRFGTTFASKEERDGSANARIRQWDACMDSIRENPIRGVGPDHWHLVSPQHGLPAMEAHSLWLQTAAEQGIPGVLTLLLFYVLCIRQLWPIARQRWPVSDPWLHDAARMVVAALCGFLVSAQFVSVTTLEVPYYVAVLGAGVLKLAGQPGVLERSPSHSRTVVHHDNFVPVLSRG